MGGGGIRIFGITSDTVQNAEYGPPEGTGALLPLGKRAEFGFFRAIWKRCPLVDPTTTLGDRNVRQRKNRPGSMAPAKRAPD